MTSFVDPDETQYDIEEIELPASFDSAILVRELEEKASREPSSPRKRPRSPSVSPPPELRERAHADLVVPTGAYLESDAYGASRFGGISEFMSRKRQKQKMQDSDLLEGMNDQDSHGEDQIFKGISVYINGHTEPSHQELRSLILKYGGVYQPYLDQKRIVTHIITTSLTPAKVREFQHMKVVTPAWLTDSVKRGTLHNWREYIFVPGGQRESTQGRRSNQTSLFAHRQAQAPPSSMRSKLFGQNADLTTSPPFPSNASLSKSLLTSRHDSQDEFDVPPPPNPLQPKSRYPTSSPSSPPPLHKASSIPSNTDMLNKDPTSPATCVSVETASKDAESTSPLQPVRVPNYAAHKSNPDAQRVMADANWRAAHTSAAPDFIEGYYKNSRLHHLSAWKAELRALVQEAQEREESGNTLEDVPLDEATKFVGARPLDLASSKGKCKQKSTSHTDRVIMHCDFDSFFVAVGLLDRPELVGKPVAVCHSQGDTSSTSEIASASYEARKFGIKGGMSLQQARKLCPTISTIPYEFDKYKRLALLFYTLLMSYADDLQAVSVDEALIEVTSRVQTAEAAAADDEDPSSQQQDQALALAEVIRTRVKHATGCVVSIGISHNIMLSRLATRRAKPNGAFHLRMPDLPAIIAPLELDDLHGFGRSAKQKAIEKFGSAKLQDLATKSKFQLCEAMGKTSGETLYNALRGIDERNLESDKPRKSVSCDINYGVRFENDAEQEAFVNKMSEEVARRLDAINVRGASLTLKLMKRHPDAPREAPKFMGHGRCETFNKQCPLSGPNGRATSEPRAIATCTLKLLHSFHFDCRELRGVAIQIQKLESATGMPPPQAGQARLPFGQRQELEAAAPVASTSALPPPAMPPPSVMAVDVDMPPPRSAPVLDLPSFSQVDQGVLDALPEEIRRELDAEYQRRSRSRSITPAPRQIALPEPAPAFGPSKKIHVKGVPAVHRITRQLALKRSTLSSPTKSWSLHKGTGFSALDVKDDELRKLDIDVEFFRALPRDIQRDQIAYARHLKSGRPLPSTAPRKVIRAPKPKRPVGKALLMPPPRPKANLPPPPTIKQAVYSADGKRQKVLVTAKEDIEDAIEMWVNSFRTAPPNAPDVEYFAKFLLRSVTVTKRDGTDGGLEKAVRVMHWWQLLLRQGWKAVEHEPEDEVGRDRVGIAWWKAFRNVKDRLNDLTRQRFGGSIVFS